MATYVKDSGAWKDASVSVKDSGVWKESPPIVNDNGTWKPTASSVDWGNISSPANQVSWSGETTLSTPGQYLISWPAGVNYFRARIYGAGGGNSNGGQGASGGYSTLYLARGGSALQGGLVLVVGDPGQFGNPGGPYTRYCSGGTDCSNYGNMTSRGFGGRPGTSRTPHNWGSTGGGFSGVFINDNNTTSPQGYKYWYCTPVAISGGGGGGQAYNTQAKAGGGHSIPSSSHYQAPPAAFNANQVLDINYTTNFGVDGNSQCYNACVFGSGKNFHPYLRSKDGNCAGGFAAGAESLGGAGFIYGQNGVHLAQKGFNRNTETLEELTENSLVHGTSSTQYSGGSGKGSNGSIRYSWG